MGSLVAAPDLHSSLWAVSLSWAGTPWAPTGVSLCPSQCSGWGGQVLESVTAVDQLRASAQ